MSASRIRATIRRAELRQAPHLTWTAFVELLTTTPWARLSPPQRVAWLAFHYDACVEMGGHARFLREAAERLDATLAALDELGAVGQRALLDRVSILDRSEPGVAEASARVLDDLDRAYHAVEPGIPELLQTWLDERLPEFVELVD